MKLKYTIIKELPNQGLYFAVTKNDIWFLDYLESFLMVLRGTITERQRQSISKRISALKNDELLLIEKA